MTKTDAEYEQSEGHPDLSNMIPPCTSQAHEMMQARRKSRSKRAAQTSHNDQASDHYLTGVQLKRRAIILIPGVGNSHFQIIKRQG